ncbi:MAG: LytTR family DNA-binding domain-containing protein [Bacteroidales bacterium]|nr:LytTR family DNA-binding domain-containing protein [Bacteroidales bacterium]
MKIKCLIVDDEPLAIKLIKNHLKHFKQFEIVAECENAIEASQILQNNNIDLLFLDIQMPEINGIDFLKSLTQRPKVIITSAYKEFAIDGFNLDVLDFLLKPITLDRFFKAINKFLDTTNINQNTIVLKEKNENNLEDIFIKDNNKTYRINPMDILYIEGMREYIKIITSSENIVTKSSLTKFYDQLPKKFFIRIHKSFIINIKKVKVFTTSNVEINNKKIPIGRSYKISTLEMLNSK